jgi:uncharacterized protein (DUF1800 family)
MQSARGTFAVLMCLSLLSPSAPLVAETEAQAASQAPKRPAPRTAYQSSQLQGDARILHALNRFTFGPRPGDLAVVRAMGLENWFDRQLHPESIDQGALESRLAQFPAMQWTTPDLLFRLPSNAVIRQAMDGKAPIPAHGALQAVYQDQIFRYQTKKEEQDRKKALEQKKLAQAATGGAMNGDMAMDKAPAMAEGQMSGTMGGDALAEPPFDEMEMTRILALPPQQRVARLANLKPPEFESFQKALKGPQRTALGLGLSPGQKEVVAALQHPQQLVIDELMGQRLTRDIYSNTQLEEVMTDFWLNHFNVYLHKNEEAPYYLVSYERDVIRPRALGRFEDLLEATAHSPAMLLYLDNASSMGPESPAAQRASLAARRANKGHEGLNENYARELMELHTLGVNGGYTQADVTQVARVLTGWTVDQPQRGGGFKFDAARHEPGAKKVLGKKIKENGELEGRELLHMLATQPATAQFLCRKLAVRFVSDAPPQSLVDRMAKSYLASDGDISAVLKTLFHSPEFWSTGVYRAKIKTPIEYVVSAARASNAEVNNPQPLANALRDLGMPLYGAVPPTGYHWESSAWVSTGALVNRMNFALTLAANGLQGVTVAWSLQGGEGDEQTSLIPAPAPESIPGPEAEEPRLDALLVGGGVSDSTRFAVLQQFKAQNAQYQSAALAKTVSMAAKPANHAPTAASLEKQDQVLAGLLLGSPEFQRR